MTTNTKQQISARQTAACLKASSALGTILRDYDKAESAFEAVTLSKDEAHAAIAAALMDGHKKPQLPRTEQTLELCKAMIKAAHIPLTGVGLNDTKTSLTITDNEPARMFWQRHIMPFILRARKAKAPVAQVVSGAAKSCTAAITASLKALKKTLGRAPNGAESKLIRTTFSDTMKGLKA